MKKLIAVLPVLLIAGCSGMGMHSSASGGMGAQSSDAAGMDVYQERSYNAVDAPVIDPRTGNLTLYHGG